VPLAPTILNAGGTGSGAVVPLPLLGVVAEPADAVPLGSVFNISFTDLKPIAAVVAILLSAADHVSPDCISSPLDKL